MTISRMGAWTSSVVVVIAIIAGLVASGLPSEQRLKRFDERRISDIRRLAHALDAYWDTHERLPADLGVLLDGRHLSRLPADSVSNLAYDYQVDAASRYQLCARFDRASSPVEPGDFWVHPEGQFCFALEIRALPGRRTSRSN